jgi:IclR family transcriptional regulator, KDG regulon repressor
MSVESPSTQARPRASVRSVDQTLDLLELLARADRPVGVTEIARSLGLSASGVHRLLTTLRDRGYASHDPVTGRYTRGLACFSLAALAASRQTLRAVADEHLRALNQATGEAVHLTVYESGHVVYIDKLESHHETAPVSRVGEQAPAHCVATGRAIIAYLSVTEIEMLIERGLDRFTDSTIGDRESLLADLEATRARGYALNRGSWRAAVGGVAAPIRDFSGMVQASVGCCLPLERLTEEAATTLAGQTIQTAAAISEELGFVVPSGRA